MIQFARRRPTSRSHRRIPRQLKQAHEKIVHCLNQLSDDQINWRPFEQQNTLANIILHLCGNLRQWVHLPASPASR